MRLNIIPYLCIILLLTTASLCSEAQNQRTRQNFNKGWRFYLGDDPAAKMPAYDDSQWRQLTLPHDWSIEGEFNERHPATPGGGALPGGTGWYRKTFTIPQADAGKLFYIEFDGIYRNSEVWINGRYLGIRPYGYSSFRYELTPYLNFGTQPNIIAVRVDNSQQPNSRWYSGSGIYRNVWLVTTGKVAVDHWGTFVTTPKVDHLSAEVALQATIINSPGTDETISLKSEVFSPDNQLVATTVVPRVKLQKGHTVVNQKLLINNPVLWSVDKPALYRTVTTLFTKKGVLDEYETPFGIRTFEFNVDKGFFLNGEQLKIKGVCNHHDLGCLGAAINTRALERQLELLKEMGCNGIRTSHNPPAPELLDLCDRMGFIVMDEAFDMWKRQKTPFDYGMYFDEWHKRDIQDMVLRDRNHPSVFIWSIGNEVWEQGDTNGTIIGRELAGLVRELDKTRPITSACNDPYPSNFIIKSDALDLIGFNYHHQDFAKFPETYPGKKFIGSETTSALATRGSYDMPADSVRRWPLRWDIPFNEGNADLTCSAYDNCSTPWGTTHEESWKIIKKYGFLSGLFIWTGFDYLGEPTPYSWPARSSYFGILDLCGFPKDSYYMYQSEWTDKPVLHILPDWNIDKSVKNWNPGQLVDVWAYSNCEEVELYLNGRSLGTDRKTGDDLHFSWKVPYEPGTLKAVGRTKGEEILSTEIKTAGLPAKINLVPDRKTIKANGQDLSFVTVQITDKDNNPVPYANNLVYFSVQGDATIAATDNGNPTGMESFKAHEKRAFNGKCLLVVKSGDTAGIVKITATAEGLQPASTEIQIKL